MDSNSGNLRLSPLSGFGDSDTAGPSITLEMQELRVLLPTRNTEGNFQLLCVHITNTDIGTSTMAEGETIICNASLPSEH